MLSFNDHKTSLTVALVGFGWLAVHAALKGASPFGADAIYWIPQRDATIAVLLLAAAAAFSIKPSRFAGLVAAGFLFVLGIYRAGIVVYPRFFGRELELQYDVWLIGNGIDLLFDTLGALAGVAAAGAFVVLASITVFGLYRLLRASHRLLLEYRGLRLAVAGSGALVFGLQLTVLKEEIPSPGALLTLELGRELVKVTQISEEYEAIDRAVRERRQKLEGIPSDLGRVKNHHVFLFLVESYGEAIWREPSYRQLIEPLRRDYERAFEQAGYHVASKFVHSPVKGGGSWLANLTLQSGVRCDNDIAYARILESDLVTLTGHFRKRGFHTVNVLPAVDVPKDSWPQGDFFQYHEQFWLEDFHYDGPTYGWSPIPDQLAVARFHEDYFTRHSKTNKLFVSFALTSSHSPFQWVPPYKPERDPNRLEALYREVLPDKFDNTYTRLRQPALGYTGTIRYSLKSVFDYAISLSDQDVVFIVLGDHQPMALLRGTESNRVPLHVISKDRELIERFRDENFAPELTPRRSRLRMEELLPFFLRTFSL